MAQLERLIRILEKSNIRDSTERAKINSDAEFESVVAIETEIDNLQTSDFEKDATIAKSSTTDNNGFSFRERLEKFALQRWQLIALALFLVLISGYLYFQFYTTIPRTVITSITPSPTVQTKLLMVHVVGEVNKPGLVQLPPGARINDALKAAGGFTKEADLGSQNLAQLVTDGMQVRILKKGDTADNTGVANGKISINHADAKTLETLSGVGPVMAEKIIEYRKQNGPFTQLKDLTKVKGFGEKLFAKVKDQITL